MPTTKFRSANNWGGARRGAGRPSKEEQEKRAKAQAERSERARQHRISIQNRSTIQQLQAASSPEDQGDKSFCTSLEGLSRLAEEAERQIANAGADGGDWGDDSDWEEDEEDSDSEDEDSLAGDTEQDNNGEPTATPKFQQRARYKPPKGSFVDQVLVAKNTQIKHDLKTKKGKHWYFPEQDPVSECLSTTPKPEDWYRQRIICYNWTPFTQYCGLVGNLQQDYKCIHCSRPCLQSNGYYWRAAFDFDKIVWIRHRRLRCNPNKKGSAVENGEETEGSGCGKTFAEIHPLFLAQLPTRVVETLPFLTRPKGPCMSTMMIFSFMSMATKGIMFGTFASIFNELYAIKHTEDHLSYLEAVIDRTEGIDRFGLTPQTLPKVFAPFQSAGEYNGIKLRPSLVRHYFYNAAEALEPYRQTSFQASVDGGSVADHTHKFASGIKIPGRRGHPFTASYSILALNGKVNVSNFSHTKSNDEIDKVVATYRDVRVNAGEEKLLRFESDGGGDRSLWLKHFPELKADTTPYLPPLSSTLAKAEISSKAYLAFTDHTSANDWACAVYKDIAEHEDKIVIAFDMEWPVPTYGSGGNTTTTRLLQLAIHNTRSNEQHIAVFDLWEMNAIDQESFPQPLRHLLHYPKAILIGHNCGNDVNRLQALGIEMKAWTDTRYLTDRLPDTNLPHGRTLKALCAHFLSLDLDKSCQTSDWSQRPLPQVALRYAALDVVATLKLYDRLCALINAGSGATFNASISSLQKTNELAPGKEATLKFRDKSVAIVEVCMVGGHGSQYKWGTKTIGARKAVVRLVRVLVESARAPFAFNPSPSERQKGVKGWGGQRQGPDGRKKRLPNKTLGEILAQKDQAPLVAVMQSSLHVIVNTAVGETGMNLTAETTHETWTASKTANETATDETATATKTANETASKTANETATDEMATATKTVNKAASKTANETATDETATATKTVNEMNIEITGETATAMAIDPGNGNDTTGTVSETVTAFKTVNETATNAMETETGNEMASKTANETGVNAGATATATVTTNVADATMDGVTNTEDQTAAFKSLFGEWNEWDEEDLCESSGEEPLRSRDKADIFHIFQDLPLPKKCPARAIISRLMIHATFQFDSEEYENVTRVLREKYRINSTVETLRHFYHNREWWRQRCPMYTPKPAEHGARIDRVRQFVATQPDLKEFYTPEMEAYFKKVARECREGKFEELPDISMFQVIGTDANGLTLYLRKRGSTKAENFHQKLWVAFGPWCIGAQTGHYLMIEVAYRYNVKIGIRRCNAHDFGHCHLHLIDRVDLLVQEIYGVELYPRHKNMLLFEGIQNVISVGITPLVCDERFVMRGPPDNRLRGEKLFEAKRQGVVCSPFPIAHKVEYKMLNTFMLQHPKPSRAQIDSLCIQFLNKTDCKEVFPKLPSMIVSALKTARESHMIRQLETQMKDPFNNFIEELAAPVKAPYQGIIEKEMMEVEAELTAAKSGAQTRTHSQTEAQGNEAAPSLAQVPKQHVPPTVAPQQAVIIPTRTGSGRRCYYWPFCKSGSVVCGGTGPQKCSEVNSGKITVPDEATLKQAKTAARNKLKRETEKKRWLERKRSRAEL